MLWDPLDLIGHWTNRPAVFFAALCFLLATLTTNISANSISAANDLVVLLPEWFDLRRGQARICNSGEDRIQSLPSLCRSFVLSLEVGQSYPGKSFQTHQVYSRS